MNKNSPKKEQFNIMRQAKRVYLILALLICLLIVIKSTDYIIPDFSRGFLFDKEHIFKFYKYFLYAHMVGAPIALITGIFQFLITRNRIHQILGKIYVFSILILAAPGGFGMAFYAIGGGWSIANFLILSILWIFSTLQAYLRIKENNILSHRTWMTRSFILANSAVLLRILSYYNNHYNLVEQPLGYILIGWLSWLPGLLIFEIWNARKTMKLAPPLSTRG